MMAITINSSQVMFRSWPVHGSDEVLQVLFLFEIYVFCENKSHAIKFILRKTLKNVIDLFSSKSKKKKKISKYCVKKSISSEIITKWSHCDFFTRVLNVFKNKKNIEYSIEHKKKIENTVIVSGHLEISNIKKKHSRNRAVHPHVNSSMEKE